MAKEYNISKPGGVCVACQKELQPGDEFVATVREVTDDLLREDFCAGCWQGRGGAGGSDVLGQWRSHVQPKQEKKRMFVDDDLLVNFFQRLEGADEPAKISFRFVLALILMRKRLLAYDRMDKLADGREAWTMHLRGQQQAYSVIDPHMDEGKITEVSQRLGEILEGEL